MVINKNLSLTMFKPAQPDFYSCDKETDYLQYDEEDTAIEAYLDELELEGVGIEKFPKTLTVYGWGRKDIDPSFLKECILEYTLEKLDEEFGGEDPTDQTVKMQEAETQFIAAILKEYTPWQCEIVSEEEIDVHNWINENRPDWLEEK